MYFIFCLLSSIIMALSYEYSGLNGLGLGNVLVSFLLFLILCLILSNPQKNYKLPIKILGGVVTLLSIANLLKVHFQLAEISFFDIKLIKAAGDIASLFIDKLPYVKILTVLSFYALLIIMASMYDSFFENLKDSYSIEKRASLERGLEHMDSIFKNRFFKFLPLTLCIVFFVFTGQLYHLFTQASFSSFLISGKSLAESYYVQFQDKDVLIKNAIKKTSASPLSNIDPNDPLMKGYPFDKPNDMDVIIMQSETFFDLAKYQDKLGENGIKIHDNDIHTNFHYYQDNGISGKIYVPTVGGGTVNTEYEVMTGYGAKYFYRGSIVFTSVLSEKMNSLAFFYKNYMQNNNTIGIHNHNADYWDRDRVYPLIGLDEFVDITQFTKEQQEDLVGAWMSDKTIFDMTKQKLDENPDKNNFILSVTVQNHGPFLGNKGNVNVDNLSERDSWEIKNYASNLKYSDEQLKVFMDDINARPKPTMVIFYGDHKPDPSYNIFKDSPYYNEKNKQNLFYTDYFIYFNRAVTDPKLLALKGAQKDISSISMNRYIQMLLGDNTAFSRYIYNYAKNPDNYFDKECISGTKPCLMRDISRFFINHYLPYESFQ